MRRIVGAAFVSLDGVMQAPGGPEEDPTGGFTHGGWTEPFWSEQTSESVGALFAEPFDLLLGRRTYDIFAAHWPYYDDNPIGRAFNSAAKYVVTSSTDLLSWANSHAIEDLDGVARLKESDGPDLIIQGSSTLYPVLLDRGLIDRLQLMTFPVVLGKGKRLFGAGERAGSFKLLDSKVSSTGVLIASYAPAGPVEVGSFADKEPSAAELARREKMKREDSPV
jgi:dihydrofolate reductase